MQQHCRVPAVGRLSGIDQNDFIPKLMIYVTQREHCQTGHFLQSCQEADGNALECSGCSGWETLEFLPGRNVCHENFFVMPWYERQLLLRWGKTTQIPCPGLLPQIWQGILEHSLLRALFRLAGLAAGVACVSVPASHIKVNLQILFPPAKLAGFQVRDG